MEANQKPGKLRDINFYLWKSFRFYELKNERLSRIIFLLILVISFLGIFVPDNIYINGAFSFISVTITFLASAVYLAAFIKDLKGEVYGIKDCFKLISKNIFKVLIVSITYLLTVAVTLGFIVSPEIISYLVIFMFIPFIIIYLMFIFNICYVLDKGEGIIKSFKSSGDVTKGYKRGIFLIIFVFNFLLTVPLSFLMVAAVLSENSLIYAFVISFIAAILNFMQQRLTALMYMDLEYGIKNQEH